jgi:hypothetical protein
LPLQEKKNAGGAKTEMANGSENVLGRLLSLLLVAAEALLLRSPLLHADRGRRGEKRQILLRLSLASAAFAGPFSLSRRHPVLLVLLLPGTTVVLAPPNARAPFCFLLSSPGRFLLLGGLLFVS